MQNVLEWNVVVCLTSKQYINYMEQGMKNVILFAFLVELRTFAKCTNEHVRKRPPPHFKSLSDCQNVRYMMSRF